MSDALMSTAPEFPLDEYGKALQAYIKAGYKPSIAETMAAITANLTESMRDILEGKV